MFQPTEVWTHVPGRPNCIIQTQINAIILLINNSNHKSETFISVGNVSLLFNKSMDDACGNREDEIMLCEQTEYTENDKLCADGSVNY